MTFAATELPEEFLSVMLIVLACTASLNVAVTFVDTATPVAPLAGDSLVTVGGAASVVNDQVNGEDMATPLLFWRR